MQSRETIDKDKDRVILQLCSRSHTGDFVVKQSRQEICIPISRRISIYIDAAYLRIPPQ